MVPRVVKGSGLLLLVGAWTALLGGLFLLPPTEDPSVDLDAGASFGLNIDVYLPAVALAVVVLVALPFIAVMPAGSLAGIGAAALSTGCATWVGSHHDLVAYVPALDSALRIAGAASIAALAAFATEATLPRPAVVPE